MSKHCEVCDRSYPDDLGACPHCAEVKEISEADVVDLGSEPPESASPEASAVAEALPVEPSADRPDSAIDFGLPVLSSDPDASGSRKGEGSSISVVEWASLVEEAPADPAPAPASFDDPADADLIGQAAGAKAEAPAASQTPAEPTLLPPSAGKGEDALSADLEAVRSIFAGDASASFVRRGAAEPAAPAAADPGEPPSGNRIEPGALEAAGSGIDLAGAELEAQVVADAAGPAPAVGAADSGADVSGVEVVDENPPADEAAIRPISDSGIDLSSMETAGTDSGPQAGIEKNTPSTSDSGVDRIAEEVESGLNLGAESFEVIGDSSSGSGVNPVEEIVVDESGMALTAGQLPVGEEEVDLTETPAGGEVESSAVDLGGSATFPAAPPEPSSGEVNDLERTRPYESKGKSIHGEDDVSPSEVNLGSRHDGDSGRDFFEPSVAMSHAPEEAAEGEDAGLEGVDEESGVSVQEEAEEQEGASGVEEAEEALAPPAKEKRRSTAGAWSGGLVLGGVVTAGALLALWLFKIEPPAEWRSILGGGAPTTGAPTGPKAQGPAIAALTSAEKADLVKSGDLDRAAKAGIENADESKPEEVAARGQFRVRQYLMAQGGKAANPDDPDMKKGVDDLEKARDKNDDALFWLGVSKESAEKLDEAKKLYEEGAARFKDDPAKRQRFQDALNRISAEMGRKPAGVSEAAPMLDPALFVLIVTGLDAAPPAPQPPAAPAASEEAGSKFWEATKLAQDGKYDEALKALAAAIDRHKTRRFGALGKAQNPNSDPTEEIFLHSCQELEGYWKLRQNLQNTGLSVVKGADPAADVASLVNDYKNLSDERVQADKDILTLNTKLTKSNNDLTAANAKLADATKQVTDTQTKLTDANTDLTKTKDALAASEKKADGLAKDLTTTKQAVADKDAALKGVADALGAKPEGVVEAAKEAVKLKSVEESAKIIRDLRDKQDSLTAERDGLRTNLKERWQPEQMLSFWLPLLPERQDLADKAILDADRVLKDDKASPADKAHAHAVKGIALSDQEKYNDAKPELSKAKADLPKEDGEWVLATDAALTDASDPSASLARKADEYRKEGRNAQALALLDKAIKAAPQAPTALLIKRGGLHLQEALAHGKGQVVEGDADLTAARQDASKAMESKTAAAFYLGGRIAEAKGKRDAAADDYRQALTAHAALDADGARYRAALARMLTPASQDAAASLDPAMTEAQKLADEILADKDPKVPFEARAQALAVQGLWTEALTDFVDGLRPHLGQERAAVLQAIVQGHPALRRPTVMVVADPVAASKHYAAGLQWWNDRDFAKAEKEFFTAVEHDGQDARYYYYLGLSKLMQGDRDAFEDFAHGARLEHQDRPDRAAVSAALERIQGEPRDRLNAVRDRPR